jgi:transposase
MMEQGMAVRNRAFTRSGLSVMYPDAAGIDVGSAAHFVAVPPDRDDTPVREFASFTADLNALADWLERCEVKIVAMESTGVYWVTLYELLERRGFEVLLVNARHVKNVSGRKSDVLDCQWLQQLLSFGLLRGAFRPGDAVCELRSIVRQREMVLRNQSRCVQHMHKALAQMNIQLANVISDVVGVTGQKILRAIIAGERDRQVLAAHRDRRIKAKKEEIAKSLEGNWRAEHLFALRQAMSAFDFCGQQLSECDAEMQRILAALELHQKELPKAKKRSTNRNAPKFDLREQLYKFCGVDLTQIDGIDVSTALVVLSEIGADLSRFATVKHFTSWLGLCPGTKISGGKVLGAASKRSANRAAQALKIAAAALRSSQSALGAYYRRMCARMDKPKAVTATAHKLARLIYLLITRGQAYVDQGQQYYEQRYRDRVIRQLQKRATDLGLTLVPSAQPA